LPNSDRPDDERGCSWWLTSDPKLELGLVLVPPITPLALKLVGAAAPMELVGVAALMLTSWW
jgi:hypothetical protein